MPLTAAELAQAQRAFLAFDRNSDGTIDGAELLASLVTLGHPEPSKAEVNLMIAEFDSDKSGGVDFAEFVTVIERQKAQTVGRDSEADTLEAFVAMGGKPDRSGQVSVERLAATILDFELRVDLPRLLGEMDLDEDGTVDYEEFKALLAGR
ncbi:flagellar outer dynein arm light chain 5 [Micractinium conductrix]|uniref:Flagellar outer dynein arm light chain 5 n=1 Tax=Micractinium conductrix TaxID=554055 RepID=A0A2P6V5C7_9CHLO|nr:flagellar outer dynein arm light chain 5 [Micractinium conductrix]|eukprot:PSC69267.1 flagellar outer dynein arm light chain 5 [Micractinium conductrix]